MTSEELEKERDSATGNVAAMVRLAREIEGKEGLSLEIERFTLGASAQIKKGGYFFRSRQNDLTGTYYGSETPITEEDAREARRLCLTFLAIPGIDD